MALHHTWLNPLAQFGRLDIDIIITDDEGIIPECRVSKSFKQGVDLNAMAAIEKQKVQANWDAQQQLGQ